MRRKETAEAIFAPTVVNQNRHAAIRLATDNSPHRLQDAVHSGIGVGVVIACLAVFVVVFAQDVPLA